MNNEIKEILDTFKWCVEQPDIDDEQLVLTGDLKKLLDYITNLQEELKGYKQERENLFKTIHDLQKKNKRLKNIINENTILVQDENGNYQECDINVIKMYNDMQNDIDELVIQKARLREENERLKANKLNDYMSKDNTYYKDMLIYKSRIDKAIEYNYELQERYCHSALFDNLVASKVYEITEKQLNILNGGDKDV